jgi:hypothetical protein
LAVTHYVYCWHEPALNAIKVGYGREPHQRMLDYAKLYRLNFDERSLVAVKVPDGTSAEVVEEKCHRALFAIGLEPVLKPHPTGFRFGCCSRELFRLGTWDYASVLNVLRWTIFPGLSRLPPLGGPTARDGGTGSACAISGGRIAAYD